MLGYAPLSTHLKRGLDALKLIWGLLSSAYASSFPPWSAPGETGKDFRPH